MARQELLKMLWEAAALLDDKQLKEGTELLAALAYRERSIRPKLPESQVRSELSHVDFVNQLSDKLRTSEEAY